MGSLEAIRKREEPTMTTRIVVNCASRAICFLSLLTLLVVLPLSAVDVTNRSCGLLCCGKRFLVSMS